MKRCVSQGNPNSLATEKRVTVVGCGTFDHVIPPGERTQSSMRAATSAGVRTEPVWQGAGADKEMGAVQRRERYGKMAVYNDRIY